MIKEIGTESSGVWGIQPGDMNRAAGQDEWERDAKYGNINKRQSKYESAEVL